MSRGWITRALFFATLFCVTFQKLQWEIAGSVELADILTILFLVAFVGGQVVRSDRWLPRAVYVLLAFMAVLLLVYLVGFFNIETKDALDQFYKGLAKFIIHFAFLAAGVAYLGRRSERFYWQALGVFCGGMVANAAYGALQLAVAERGGDLDSKVVTPLTGTTHAINVYGGVEGQSIYRPNALAGDPNHLAVMLIIPLVILTPIYLRLERKHRLRIPLALVIAFLLLIELATLSRSGLLGLAAGTLVLLVPYRRKLFSKLMLLPLAGAAAVLAIVVASRPTFFETIFKVRTQTGGSSASAHFHVYSFIPHVLQAHPLFGLGLNNFSVYYEFITGKTNWGPHSFYVALIVETGVVGTLVFAAFIGYIFWRLRLGIRIGKALAAAGDLAAARVRPLGWGLVAALVGTMAANFFYLTMQFYYFYAFAVLALAFPVVFSRRVGARP